MKLNSFSESEEAPKIELDGQDQNYCPVCEIQLTSAIVAQNHYTGKPHQKKLAKRIGKSI